METSDKLKEINDRIVEMNNFTGFACILLLFIVFIYPFILGILFWLFGA